MSYWQFLEIELMFKPARANIQAWASAERDTKPAAYCSHEVIKQYAPRKTDAKPLSRRKLNKIKRELRGELPLE